MHWPDAKDTDESAVAHEASPAKTAVPFSPLASHHTCRWGCGAGLGVRVWGGMGVGVRVKVSVKGW